MMIKNTKETLFDFVQFLKNPKDEKLENKTKTQVAISFIVLLLFCYLVVSIPTSIIYFLEKFGFYSTNEHAITGLMERLPITLLLLNGVIVMPFAEELVFRLPLRFKNNLLFRFIIFLSGILGKRKKVNVRIFLNKKWKKHYIKFFYILTILFAYVHLFNFKNTPNILLFSPLLVMPQFIAGLVLGYIRVKYNFLIGFLFHATYNAILFISVIFIFNQLTIRRNDVTTGYKITIEDCKKYSNDDAISTIGDKKINFENYSLNNAIAELLNKNIDLIETNNIDSFNKKINLKFEQLGDSTLDNKTKVLALLSETYHFKMTSLFKFQYMYELNLFDSVLFNKHTQKFTSTLNSINNGANVLKLKNVNLDELAKTISLNYKLNVSNNTESLSTFNFEIPTNDFNRVVYILKSDYGIALEKKYKTIEFIKIEFPVAIQK
jgi:membrane protease YdiL (CAAX protease family)/calcineurin-like phosphoesterase family protein